MRHLLIVDDEELNYQTLRYILSQNQKLGPFQIEWAPTVKKALEIVQQKPLEVILLDVNLPDGLGHQAIPRFKELDPLLEIIVISGSTQTKDILESLKAGALSYMTRPLRDAELFFFYLETAYERRRLKIQAASVERDMQENRGHTSLVGCSAAMKQVRTQLEALSKVNSTVLITGESGTGKGVAAAFLNESRQRHFEQSQRPFLNLNIAGITDTLAESELFGHERGAFTDAKQSQPGFFELADKGDIFLDEIGDASPAIQSKLLKVLQERQFYRIGGRTPIHSDFTLVCATNRDLRTQVKEGSFREDLFMRIATFHIQLPPLRERRDDIPELIKFHLPRLVQRLGVTYDSERFPTALTEELQAYPFDGNIRELESLLERFLVFYREAPCRLNDLLSPGSDNSAYGNGMSAGQGPLTLQELQARAFDLLSAQQFPGFDAVCRMFEHRILMEAKAKFPTQAEIARVLKLSKGTVSLRMRQTTPLL